MARIGGWLCVYASALLACTGDDESVSTSDGTSTMATSPTTSTATSTATSTSTTTSQTSTTDPNACPPFEGRADTCLASQCCDDSGKLWLCGCEAQCESNCCSYQASTNYCIGPSGPDGLYTCGAGVPPENMCPSGQRLGAQCDPETDGTGCCDDENRAWQCDCATTPCMWQMQDCNVDPACE